MIPLNDIPATVVLNKYGTCKGYFCHAWKSRSTCTKTRSTIKEWLRDPDLICVTSSRMLGLHCSICKHRQTAHSSGTPSCAWRCLEGGPRCLTTTWPTGTGCSSLATVILLNTTVCQSRTIYTPLCNAHVADLSLSICHSSQCRYVLKHSEGLQ